MEEIAFENGRISDFQRLVTLTLDRVILHTVMHHSSTSTYTPNIIKIEETFLWTDGRTDGWTFETDFIRSTHRSPPNKVTTEILSKLYILIMCCFGSICSFRPRIVDCFWRWPRAGYLLRSIRLRQWCGNIFTGPGWPRPILADLRWPRCISAWSCLLVVRCRLLFLRQVTKEPTNPGACFGLGCLLRCLLSLTDFTLTLWQTTHKTYQLCSVHESFQACIQFPVQSDNLSWG